MKLIFVNRYFHPDHSATAQLLSDVAFHLAGEGAEVHVIASRSRYDDPAASLSRSEEIRPGPKVRRVSSSRFGRARLGGRLIDYLIVSYDSRRWPCGASLGRGMWLS